MLESLGLRCPCLFPHHRHHHDCRCRRRCRPPRPLPPPRRPHSSAGGRAENRVNHEDPTHGVTKHLYTYLTFTGTDNK